MMNKAVADLLIVQDRDATIASLQKAVNKVPVDKQSINRLKEVRELEFKKAKASVQEVDLAIRSLERDVETRRVTIGRLKSQQFETRKNDEYQAMGKEIIRYEQEVDALETRQLTLMDELEKRQEEQLRAREKRDKVLAAIDAELAKCDERGENLQKELEGVMADRKKLADKVDEHLLKRYEVMKKSKGLPVVVLMSDAGECGGCHTKVIRSTETAVRDGREIVECENCERILH